MSDSCKDYEVWLAASAEANALGQSLDNWAWIKAHLQGCRDCLLEYGWLLCFWQLEKEGLLPIPNRIPPLNTSFLSQAGSNE